MLNNLLNSFSICYICLMKTIFYSPDVQEAVSAGSGHPSGPHRPIGYEITVNGKPITMPERFATRESILEKSGHTPVSCHSLYMKLADCDFERIAPHQKIDLDNPGLERFITKDPDVFPYTVNKDPELTQEKEMTPRAIIRQAGLNPEKVYLVETNPDGTETEFAFHMDVPVCMNCRGLHFITREWLEEVDIEEYGKHCKPVPPAKRYLVKVDKAKFPWPAPTVSVEQLIRFIYPTNPANYNVVKFLGNTPKPVPVPYTGTVDLREKCLLRFVLQPKTQNDGLRSFSLPEEDTDFLNTSGFLWEALAENGYMWVLLHNYPVPEGYQTKSCTVALMIAPTYPAAEIDMAYFHPHLVKTSGKTINATSFQTIGGNSFQRWSRHRLPGEWKPGVDSIATHLLLVNNWLENDLNR